MLISSLYCTICIKGGEKNMKLATKMLLTTLAVYAVMGLAAAIPGFIRL
jgi:hypothetical protein